MTSLTLYAADPDATAAFYRAIELGLVEQDDGEGIPHLATDLGSVHFAIYPAEVPGRARERGSAGSFSLGFNVKALDRAVEALAWVEAQILTGHEQTAWGCRIVAEDPDGRAVELSQCGHCPCS
jgi:catechol 2,3-dioxygenase-like lactoylglutathione lyase family enzyme